MILQCCINADWLQHSLPSWIQRCQNANSAECVEILKEVGSYLVVLVCAAMSYFSRRHIVVSKNTCHFRFKEKRISFLIINALLSCYSGQFLAFWVLVLAYSASKICLDKTCDDVSINPSQMPCVSSKDEMVQNRELYLAEWEFCLLSTWML